MNKTKNTKQIWVPGNFWDGHADRCPCDNAETDMAEEINRRGNRVLIEANAKQLEVLRSDAAFYCHRWGPDDCPASLKRSAKATLDAIAKAATE